TPRPYGPSARTSIQVPAPHSTTSAQLVAALQTSSDALAPKRGDGLRIAAPAAGPRRASRRTDAVERQALSGTTRQRASELPDARRAQATPAPPQVDPTMRSRPASAHSARSRPAASASSRTALAHRRYSAALRPAEPSASHGHASSIELASSTSARS